MKVLLITPPMTQMNSPYPATPYLKAFLNSLDFETYQMDLGLELILKIFSKSGLTRIKQALDSKWTSNEKPDSVQFFLEAFDDYLDTIEPLIRFLQGKDSSLALRIANRKLLPEGPRFLVLQEHQVLISKFGEMGLQDQAKYIGSLYLDDLADMIKHGLDPDFEFSRYGEKLASSQNSFEPLYQKLTRPTGLIDEMLEEIVLDFARKFKPDVTGISVPFAGNVYGGLKVSQILKKFNQNSKIVMGGGYVNTELRGLKDPRIFKFVDYLVFDDGEKPMEQLLQFIQGKLTEKDLLRVKSLKNGGVEDFSNPLIKDLPFKESLTPDYSDLKLSEYISMVEMPNPMHRMWSDFRWNKLILAHGCYWKKCTFCDVNLDYIGRFEPQKAERIVDHIEKIMAQTGSTGFHFVDEAAPPALLKQLSHELIRRKVKISWWGNLRFDTLFNSDLAQLMADAGCVAVTGGLEVANSRLLKLINKGIEVDKVAQVTKAFKDAGIYVHAYLMYGFPTQTDQETIDSLEIVRQLFESECLDSAYWHRFLATAHSPVGKSPQDFGIELLNLQPLEQGLFAQYEIPFKDPTKASHDKMAYGLRKALYNYMHGVGLEEPLNFWFEEKVPKTSVKKDFIQKSLSYNT
jgi:radical SAM superfamily enzyme YgiQ (UPF0313 family)